MQHPRNHKDATQTTELSAKRKTLAGLVGIGAISAVGVWSKPVVNFIVLPAHAQMSGLIPSDVFSAGTYAFEFPNGGVQNTSDCDAGSANAGNTLTVGIADFSADIGADGSFTAGILAQLTGSTTIENVINVDGSINFNDTFNFTDPVLGACATEVTITGTAAGTSISGSVAAETNCAGCTASFSTTFTASRET